MTISNTFVTSNNFAAIRTAASMTVQQVADKVGVSVLTVKAWEAGTNHPQRHNKVKVSNLLDSIIHRSSLQFSYSLERAEQLVSEPTQ